MVSRYTPVWVKQMKSVMEYFSLAWAVHLDACCWSPVQSVVKGG